VSTLEEYVKGLDALKMKVVQTYYSPGTRERASKLASMADKSYAFLKGFFKADADLSLLVLDSNDWSKRLPTIPYGLLVTDMGVIHLAAETEAPAVKALSPMFDNCSESLKNSLTSAMDNEKAAFNKALQTWFDHFIVHEFTHGFCEKRRISFGATWLNELFANYTTYAFLKRFEAEYKKDLSISKIVSKIVYQGGRSLIKHSSLEDFDRLYARVGLVNFIWYHGKFLLGVFELYEKYGESFIGNLIETFEVTDDLIGLKIGKSCKGFEKWFETWKHEN